MNKKTLNIVEGIAAVILGVLIAVFGGVATLNLYFSILFIAAGVGILAFDIAALVKTGLLSFALTFFGIAIATLGIGMLVNGDIFAAFVSVVFLVIIAAGATLVAVGVWSIFKKAVFFGIGQIFAGTAGITIAVLYVALPGFARFFWVIVGVLVAMFGLYIAIPAFSEISGKKSKKAKK